MKDRSGLGLLALVALFLIAGVSDAQAIWHNDVNDPCPTYEDCTMLGDPTETGSGPLKDPFTVTCSAMKSLKQGCRACVQDYNYYGQPTDIICGYVESDGGCNCQGYNQTCKTTGTCRYFAQ